MFSKVHQPVQILKFQFAPPLTLLWRVWKRICQLTVWKILKYASIYVIRHMKWSVVYFFNSVFQLCLSIVYTETDVFQVSVKEWSGNDIMSDFHSHFTVFLLFSGCLFKSRKMWSKNKVWGRFTHPLPPLWYLRYSNIYGNHYWFHTACFRAFAFS